jgi:serine/threonine protein kinase
VGDLAPGVVVAGRFVLDRLIGQGGMGMVWCATHTVTGKSVALKMLKPDRAGDPVVRARFLREARAVCAVRHPNIVQIHDVLEMDDGAPVMVMDLLDGESLGARLEREPRLSLEEVARILIPTVSAVGTAHAAGIIHRDLKPDNIFLGNEGGLVVVRVLDFGIAKVQTLDGDSAPLGALTGTGAMLGTPFYMSPEQIFGERDVDQRADVWAIGVILYECLSGVRPTQAENMGQILRILMTESIVPLQLLVPEVPDDVAELVGRMLHRDRQQRPRSMAEIQAVLQRYAPDAPFRTLDESSKPRLSLNTSGDRAVISKVRDVSPTAATLSSTTASTTADRAAVRRTQSRTPLLVGSALVLVVATGSAGVYVATRPAPASSGPGVPVSAAIPSAPASAPAPQAAPSPVPPATAVAPAASSVTAAEAATLRPAATSRPGATRSTAPELQAPAVSSTPANPAKPNAYDHM